MNDRDVGLSEQQLEAIFRRAKVRKALASAPELAYQLRWDSTPLDGRTERGDLPNDRTPMLTSIVDAADELYLGLHAWVLHWATILMKPSPEGWYWRRTDGLPLGLRASTSPEDASSLVSSASLWLLEYEGTIAGFTEGPAFQDSVSSLIWDLRTAAGLTAQRKPSNLWEKSTRPCPSCLTASVRAEFFGEPISAATARGERLVDAVEGIQARCIVCGWVATRRRDGRLITMAKLARWVA